MRGFFVDFAKLTNVILTSSFNSVLFTHEGRSEMGNLKFLPCFHNLFDKPSFSTCLPTYYIILFLNYERCTFEWFVCIGAKVSSHPGGFIVNPIQCSHWAKTKIKESIWQWQILILSYLSAYERSMWCKALSTTPVSHVLKNTHTRRWCVQ